MKWNRNENVAKITLKNVLSDALSAGSLRESCDISEVHAVDLNLQRSVTWTIFPPLVVHASP